MDYIQSDLDIIRKASGETPEADTEKKLRKKKTPKNTDDTPRRSKTSDRPKKRPKTLSPEKIKREIEKMKQKEKKSRKSFGGTLGKIKLPGMKKITESEQPATKSSPSVKRGTHKQVTKEVPSPSSSPAAPSVATKSKKSLDPNAIPIEAIRFEEGAKIEAVDHGQWYKAKIVEVDHEKMDILVHFEGWGSKFDTWFKMTSMLIRGRTQLDAKAVVPKFEPGEDVLARWSDGNFYPATVMGVKSSGSCQVMYFDGMKKLIRPAFIKKMSEKEKEVAMQAVQKMMQMPPPVTTSPQSSAGAGSPMSDGVGRRYRTSANDRERRSTARGSLGTPNDSPEPGATTSRRATKRKAAQISKEETVTPSPLVTTKKDTATTSPKGSDDDEFKAKQARLDQIASTLINRVSPTSDIIQKEAAENTAPAKRDHTPASPVLLTPPQSKTVQDAQVKKEDKEGDVVPQIPIGASQEADLPTEVEETTGEPKDSIPLSEPAKDDDQPTESSTGRSYQAGDIVLAKWADCRSYLAYIIEKEADDNYKIRYYDGMVKVVKSSFIHPWVGPLPESLKQFKPKAVGSRNQRSKSTEVKRQRGRPAVKTPDVRSTGLVTKGTVESPLARIERRRTTSDASPPSRRRRRTESNEMPVADAAQFKKGERVIAKWTDLRWYPATVVSKKGDDHYQVRYADDMTKIVRDTWLSSWNPPPLTSKQTSKTVEVEEENKKEADSTYVKQEDSFTADATKQEPEIISSKEKESDTTQIVEEDKKQNEVVQIKSLQTDSNVPPIAESARRGKKLKIIVPGNTVLARYKNGTSYPATVKKLLDDGKFLVEYDNGIQVSLKVTQMKPWSATALPPLSKKKIFTTGGPAAPATAQVADSKDKSPRQATAKQGQMPRQVVRGYEAYYARLPAQEVVETDHHKFKCRVPGCTKSFRKEQILKQHHKNFHQQRYKLRDQDSHPAPVKRKSSKEDVPRRRVSADYEAITKKLEESTGKFPQSRGAKPPIAIYQQQQGKLSASSMSSSLDSSGFEETEPKLEIIPNLAESSKATLKQSVQESEKITPKRRSKRSRTGSMENNEPGDATGDVSEQPQPEGDKSPENMEVETSKTLNEDVIRCVCDVEEEDGFMIQCEGCLTWQHATCIGIEQPEEMKQNEKSVKEKEGNKTEDTNTKKQIVEEGYICWVCKNPDRVRRSKKYLYNNDFLTKGKLPSLVNLGETQKETKSKEEVDAMMLSSLMDAVVKMQQTLHGIRHKIKIATSATEHPLLKTWKGSKSEASVTTPQEEQKATTPDGETATSSSNNQETKKNGNEESPKHAKTKSGPKKSQTPTPGEGHEAHIRNCRENLLDHVLELESVLESRIVKLTEVVSKFDSTDTGGGSKDIVTIQQDLTAVQKLLSHC